MMRFLDRLDVAKRFVLLGVIGLVLCVIPATLHVRSAWQVMHTSSLEAQGIAPAKSLLKVIQLTQQHRGLTAMVLRGQAAQEAPRAAKQQEVDRAVEAATALAEQRDPTSVYRTAWTRNAKDWVTLRERVSARNLEPADSFAAHTRLVADLLLTMEESADEFGLSLDPELDSYKLMLATNFTLPALSEELGKMRAIGAGMLAAKAAGAAEQTEIAAITVRAQELITRMMRDFDKASGHNAQMKEKLAAPMRNAVDGAQASLQLAREQLLVKQASSYASADYFAHVTKAIDRLIEVNEQGMTYLAATLEARVAAQRRELAAMILLMLAMIGIGAWVAVAAARSITRQLGGEPAAVMEMAAAIARGDLTATLSVPRGSENSIVGTMARMRASLAETVGVVRNASEAIATGSSQIAGGSIDLSQRTEEQASNLQETAASMEQLNSTVKNSADSAQQAAQLARAASHVAARGGEVVSQVVSTMGEIQGSSQRIADIIGTIDGIAFQTNILALNAAVEAARAGEQGRGFAVVAGEVRSLAQRAADAAKEIKGLITNSVDKVGAGTRLVDEAGRTMGELVQQVRRVSDLISEISAATQEQTSGIDQVNTAVTQLDQVTQQNAALVEQSTAAAESLKEQAKQLVQSVSVFRLHAA
jgi:methyl-accepting chemotaxis protein